MDQTNAVILAAGKGTRMKSKWPKVLHPVCGKPMVQHVIDAVHQTAAKANIYVVVGHGAEHVRQELGEAYTYVMQEEQLGTGHAVLMAEPHLREVHGQTLVLCGDTPLITTQTLQAFLEAHEQAQAAVSILTTIVDDPAGYGRIIRDEQGHVTKIVEHKDATPAEQQVKEINTGIYCFDNQKLMYALSRITNDNAQGEYYLTDCIEVLEKEGEKVAAYITRDTEEIMGVNDRVALAQAEKVMRRRINERHMCQGVTLIDPEQTYIGPDVVIGQDTVIYPGTVLTGRTVIDEDCQIGPYTELANVEVGKAATIAHSKAVDSRIGEKTQVGPFAYIRPGTTIGNGCRVGNFVEVKNSVVKDGAKIPHLSYVGDADIGERVNMGCGSITVNYDGSQKHRTVVENDSFVGCNVNLVAPVTIGEGAYIAAGSTITHSVPGHSLAIARERQTVKEDYARKLKQGKQRQDG
ncbi:bifunctional UDP-N-acetylglucosamine pyrophosphorylase/glucosamine-1-phosphate N-acetyltransferase [Caldalkalibacillus uzonensis]|uniref:Bifunctional protein GlmU n=1 Tax=Caldalkalibacillus uzonensis TaxID=353224 RepID=A0ABU0CX86_9BACI|nr:bifunctional UDP-N-acetylglucosamine diphosphorylase/glucosamine-1-phosphate N-acetyltransferase GlmU [Caldalkalibacillus uzonensis]MDQ0340636.1 bifunctional UDP-N-acetylglucosamine pyrophosphorylase/glucosamine-1-phosphate N-acetyltransferase [Caldalkalibacillus uzonensis]